MKSLLDLDRRASIVTVHSSSLDSGNPHSSFLDSHAFITLYKRARRLFHSMGQGRVNGKNSTDSNGYDLSASEREDWEQEQLLVSFNIPESSIDPAPFHLVRKTSLHRIHSIFSMLQLSKAYVIDCGRLVGVVSLSDVRRSLQQSLSDEPMVPMERRPSVAVSTQGLVRTASLRLSKQHEKVHDVLTPTLEVVGAEAKEERNKEFIRRENETLRLSSLNEMEEGDSNWRRHSERPRRNTERS